MNTCCDKSTRRGRLLRALLPAALAAVALAAPAAIYISPSVGFTIGSPGASFTLNLGGGPYVAAVPAPPLAPPLAPPPPAPRPAAWSVCGPGFGYEPGCYPGQGPVAPPPVPCW